MDEGQKRVKKRRELSFIMVMKDNRIPFSRKGNLTDSLARFTGGFVRNKRSYGQFIKFRL